MPPTPKKLATPPILEAVAEIRFEPVPDKAADTLLPGFLHGQFAADFPKIEATGIQGVLSTFRAIEPKLSYTPTTRLIGDKKTIVIGERVLAVSLGAPYAGWHDFFPLILKVFRAAKSSGATGKIERASLKYVNFLEETADRHHLAQTTVNVKLGDDQLDAEQTHVRSEIKRGDCLHIVQIVTQALAGDPKKLGVVVDIDIIHNGPFEDFWRDIEDHMTTMHEQEKSQFFSLLTKGTLERYGPQY